MGSACRCGSLNLCFPSTTTISLFSRHSLLPNFNWRSRRRTSGIIRCSSVITGSVFSAIQNDYETASFDPDLRLVLELATDSELFQLHKILFGPSYFSPLLKSIANKEPIVEDFAEIELQDFEQRLNFIENLESRFLFLAADARSTLRGWRPSYRNVLLGVRKKLKIPCSVKLSTEDLEAEVFLFLVNNYESEELGTSLDLKDSSNETVSPLQLGVEELKSLALKGGGMFTLTKVYELLGRKLTGKVFLEAANYQVKKELLKKGGQLAATNLESRVALLAAKQGFVGAASRYLGFRSVMSLLGPMLWGTFLADVVIQMLGTDYARILRAIYVFAQIRITRTYRS